MSFEGRGGDADLLGVDGIRDSDPLLSEEEYFANTNQLFVNVELIF